MMRHEGATRGHEIRSRNLAPNNKYSGGPMITVRLLRHAICSTALGLAVGTALYTGLALAPAAAQTQFRAGISDPVNTVLAWWMAENAGFYKEQGLDVKVVDMQGGSRGAQALQQGDLEVMHVGLSSVIRINRAGG